MCFSKIFKRRSKDDSQITNRPTVPTTPYNPGTGTTNPNINNTDYPLHIDYDGPEDCGEDGPDYDGVEDPEDSEDSGESDESDLQNINNDEMGNFIVILDNGHSQVTAGKRSPILEDGSQFFEWQFNNEIVNRIMKRLKELHIKCIKIVPENDDPNHKIDVGLTARANRANSIYATNKNCIYVSVHANAAGCGDWMNATGWSVYCAKKCSDKSKVLANCMANAAEKFGLKVRRCQPGVNYYQENFTVLTKTNMPAVLTENFFYDNRDDLAFIQSEKGKQIVTDLHVNAILDYMQKISK